jgi:hypothetical protein
MYNRLLAAQNQLNLFFAISCSGLVKKCDQKGAVEEYKSSPFVDLSPAGLSSKLFIAGVNMLGLTEECKAQYGQQCHC